MARDICQISFPATFLDVRNALEKVRGQMARNACPEDCLNSVEIVLAEAMNNIVEHAYPTGTTGKIGLSVWQGDLGLDCAIFDEGRPVPERIYNGARAPAVDADTMDLPEGGFGLFMILELAEGVKYSRRGSENCLAFHIPCSTKNPKTAKQTN